MPGIAGIISRSRIPRLNHVEQMTRLMMHEPFYRSGTLTDDNLGIAIGWTTHANSASDCLPIWNETRDICLIFIGDHFSDSDEIVQLRARGHVFDKRNASALVHLYEENSEK